MKTYRCFFLLAAIDGGQLSGSSAERNGPDPCFSTRNQRASISLLRVTTPLSPIRLPTKAAWLGHSQFPSPH
ncbi:hypothetical protein B0T16DRAFT_164887 [Cercophora newfieldiana]|uniref:Secreted protein n=1 Tax=Cercophora newfieldiana TaxID=92897 RepID=A0AA40CPR6_9PEZI|nr:hypothetical protein B0T16DRAFT_164887 [Cercophora newfieldiana]